MKDSSELNECEATKKKVVVYDEKVVLLGRIL